MDIFPTILLVLAFVTGSWAFWDPSDANLCQGRLDSDGNQSRLEVVSFDGQILKITKQQKTLLSRWDKDPNNVCKYQLAAVTKGSGTLQYTEIHFSFDVHPKNNKKFARTWILGNNATAIYSRGYGSKGKILKTLPVTYSTIEDNNMLNFCFLDNFTITEIKIRTELCTYAVNWAPIQRTWKFYLKAHNDPSDVGFETGLCGNMDGNADNDLVTCGSQESPPDNLTMTEKWEYISDSCKIRK